MPTRRTTALAAAGGLVAGAALASMPLAAAGHLNTVLLADLDGRNEVAAGATNRRIVGDPDGSGEIYVFRTDASATTLCYVLLADGIAGLDLAPGNGRAAHIHRGAEGVNGPVVANLAWPTGGQAADCLAETDPTKFPTNADADPANDVTVAEILASPGDFYVNVHNTEHPGGALRGQLETQHSH